MDDVEKQTEEQANQQATWVGHWAWDVVSGILLVIYVALSLHYAHTLLARLDGGLYTVKGYFFAIGKYWPYQDYGPLTNHMPLSFLIPGYVQKWFGPGIRVSRHYAVVMGTLTMLGLWLTARRLGGRAWGSAALLSVVVSPYLIKTYSLELSQVLVAAMLSWTLFFILGAERKTWHLAVGGLLAGMAMMTRLNMAPLLPFMLLYILWQYGWRKALAAGAAGGVVVLVLHLIYWPGILRMWAYWVPQGIFGFLDPYYEPWRKTFAFHRAPLSEWIGNIDSVQWNPVIAFWQGMRFYFPGLTAAFATMLLWPKRRAWGSAQRFRQTLVLVVLFLVLLGMHMWAALGGNSCHIFCYLNYLTFFYILGPLMLISSLSIWRGVLPKWRSIPIILFVCLYLAGIGFSTARQIAPPIGDILVPRVSSGSLQPGSIELWGMLANKFDLNYLESIYIIAVAAGLALGVVLAALVVPVVRRYWRKFSYGGTLLLVIMALGTAFSPAEMLAGGAHTNDCGTDVLSGYEAAGAELAEYVKPGMKVYWRGGQSTMPMLYIADAEFYPAQMNDIFTFSTDASIPEDALLRYGLWDEDLKQKWIAEADIILVEGRRLDEWQPLIDAGRFEVPATTAQMEPCRGDNSRIYILTPVR